MVVFLAIVMSTDGPKLGPALFIVFVQWPFACCGAAILAKIGFEHWILKINAAGTPAGVPPMIADHTRSELKLQTVIAMGAPLLILLAGGFAWTFTVETRARQEFTNQLQEVSNVPNAPVVVVDGKPLTDARVFLVLVRGAREATVERGLRTHEFTLNAQMAPRRWMSCSSR